MLQYLHQLFHAFRCPFLNLCDITASTDGVGVDEVDRNAWTHIMDESCCGIDVERRADDNEDVGSLCLFGRDGDVGNSLAKEDDERTQQGAITSFRTWFILAIVWRQLLLVAWIVGVVA